MAVLVLFGVGVGTLLYNEQAAIVQRSSTPTRRGAPRYYANIDLAVNVLTLAGAVAADALPAVALRRRRRRC